MILHHSAKPKPDPIPTPTPRTPSSAYARCDDCGTSQGEPCYDSHDRPCAPCHGRVLASTGAERREAQERSKRPPAKSRASRAKPAHHCAHCGVRVQASATWCSASVCQSAKKRHWRATHTPEDRSQRVRKPRPSRAKPGPPSTCTVCGVVVQRGGRFCRAHKTERLQDLYARRLAAARVVPCWWCRAILPLSGNAGGRFADCERPCCGDHACKRAIKRDFAERSRSTTPRETKQQHNA